MEHDHNIPPEETPGRQTLTHLRETFDRHGIRPKNKLGQNFLIDLNVLDLLVRAARLRPDDIVVEVGAGTGGLTARLADIVTSVLSIEIDPAFHSLASENLADYDNITLLHGDALKNKNQLHPDLTTAIGAMHAEHPDCSLKLIANLPYAVATPVIANLLLSELPIERYVVTVQWEIAKRLIAKPDRKAYGALGILVQSVADVYLERRLPPTVFWPRPQVFSAIVSIVPNARKRAKVGDVRQFREFLRDLYVHKRKNLRGALSGMPSGRRSKKSVDALLAGLNIDGSARAETLSIQRHLQLCAAFTAQPLD